MSELRRTDRLHLCRHLACPEEGGTHVQEYGVVKAFNPERFQYAQAEAGARATSAQIWSWIRGSGAEVQRLAQRAREYASESEAEEDKVNCLAGLISWETAEGAEQLGHGQELG